MKEKDMFGLSDAEERVIHSVIWGAVIVLTISSIFWSCVYYHTTVNKAFLEQGYSEEPNTNGPYGSTLWVKK